MDEATEVHPKVIYQEACQSKLVNDIRGLLDYLYLDGFYSNIQFLNLHIYSWSVKFNLWILLVMLLINLVTAI